MIKVYYTSRLLRSAKKLPSKQQDKLAELLILLTENPFDPRLHSKPLVGDLSGLFSFRITREWRVIFQFLNPDELKILDVGHRKDIYR